MTTISPAVLPASTNRSIRPRALRVMTILATSRRSTGLRAIATAPFALTRNFVALLGIGPSIHHTAPGDHEHGRPAEARPGAEAEHNTERRCRDVQEIL